MDIDWDRYKSTLKRAYFTETSFLPRECEQFDDFWRFFAQYLSMTKRKGLPTEKRPSSSSSLNELRIPIDYSKYHRQLYRAELDKPSKYILRDVPSKVVDEFEFALSSYIQFCQRQHFQRLRKLRLAQRSLPIAQYRREILDVLAKHSVVIVAGDTGCGKSTQVPQYLLDSGAYSRLVCTQPRRLACIALAKRVAYETLNEYGDEVAYQIRFEKTRTSRTKLLFLTEGLLLRQLTTDADLNNYDVIILDEIHERHIHGDFLLGVLKNLVQRRPDLKLILMSATINLELFSKYFVDAPVVQVPGRLYPIQLHYRPIESGREVDDPRDKGEGGGGGKGKAEKIDPGPYRRILEMIDKDYANTERGDVLMFLSGISEISTVADALKLYADETTRWIILILHSTLSLEEQDRVFDVAPEGIRKCILSTNIAETSVTIDGVRFVVDSGKMKEMRFDSETKMHQLKETWISQASAEQRKGRAGRTGPGVCYRLYSQKQYDEFQLYTTSEIRLVSLESLVLQMYQFGLADPRRFEFIEPPDSSSIERSIDHLKDQGAINSNELLTPLGQMLVKLPVDVAIGKMLIMGCLFRQVEVVLTMAAALSVQSPFTNRSYRDLDCMRSRKELMSSQGDAFALLNVYREWLEVKKDGGESSKRWARKRGIEEQRLYEITKLRTQFKEILEDADLIERQIEQNLTSAQRRIRQGELKQLRNLKRTYQNQQRKRKVLKMEHFDAKLGGDSDNDEEHGGGASTSKKGEDDVHAVDFRIHHTDRDLDERLRQFRLDHRGVALMKFIVAGGLYPRYGILDQHNNYKQGSDQMVHTRAKPFVVLHPNSCLAQDPECLCVQEDRQGRSTRHQSIFYSLLLETTKPYLVNTIRVSALHYCLLFARTIEVSEDFSRSICDRFVEFDFVENDRSTVEKLIDRAVRIRRISTECVERKLDGRSYRSESLEESIVEFLDTELLYSMKKLLKADLDKIYAKDDIGGRKSRKSTSSTSGKKWNEEIGGYRINDYLNIGAIGSIFIAGDRDSEKSEYLYEKWQCPKCGEEIYASGAERLEHSATCSSGKDDGGDESAAALESGVEGEEIDKLDEKPTLNRKDMDNPLKRHYYCDVCQQQLMLTPVEILKHKKSHK